MRLVITILTLLLWAGCIWSQSSFEVQSGNAYKVLGQLRDCGTPTTTWGTPASQSSAFSFGRGVFGEWCEASQSTITRQDESVAMFRFDTSSIPDNATITAASISMYGSYAQSPGFGTVLVTAGYCPVTSWPTNCVPTGGVNVAEANTLAFSTGTIWRTVNLTTGGVSLTGYTGVRVRINTSNWNSYTTEMLIYANGPSSASNKTYLSVAYTVPGGARVIMIVDSR
jgi:hypothetical protein